jgi:RNA polymerase sigma-70 factor (ECF subfamily)
MHQGEIEVLYRQHARALIAHCTSLLGNPSLARDAVHDAFERMLRQDAEPTLDDKHVVPYLYRVSTNVCLDMLRHQRVRRRAEPEVSAHAAETDARDPSHTERDYARALLDRVGPRTATVGVLHFVHGLNQQEIADELGLSRRSIFNHLRKLEAGASELDGDASQKSQLSR